ncbi:MAG: GNAT family N-acetyltransferase [Chloroflexia bacterium]
MDIQVRLARPEDRQAVFDFCSRIDDGHDYIPQVWEEWLADPRGVLLVATIDDVPVAVVRGAFYFPGEAWLEGMRVSPDHRQQGIATTLFKALVEAVTARGARVARLTTAYDNLPVHRMCAHLGFHLATRLRRRVRAVEAGTRPEAVRRLDAQALPEVRAFLARSSFLTASGGLYSWGGGVWSTWNEERLQLHLEQGQVWGWWEKGRLRAVAIRCPHRRRPGLTEVGLIEGSARACSELLVALAHEEEPAEGAQVRLFLPLEATRLHRAAAAAGYRFLSDWRGEMWVFERRLA